MRVCREHGRAKSSIRNMVSCRIIRKLIDISVALLQITKKYLDGLEPSDELSLNRLASTRTIHCVTATITVNITALASQLYLPVLCPIELVSGGLNG